MELQKMINNSNSYFYLNIITNSLIIIKNETLKNSKFCDILRSAQIKSLCTIPACK